MREEVCQTNRDGSRKNLCHDFRRIARGALHILFDDMGYTKAVKVQQFTLDIGNSSPSFLLTAEEERITLSMCKLQQIIEVL